MRGACTPTARSPSQQPLHGLESQHAFRKPPPRRRLSEGLGHQRTASQLVHQAWHRRQFLHKLILSCNPLATVEDPYLPNAHHLNIQTWEQC
ncbi:hypothetical protein QTO34_008257 [Cnephaeus nilssonii]|uniref:Uncharacterized protein n=1 Tax=Cnephaeus nilssonii TaxID=3371016 RepID=A0AA40IB28_CNENI|nr:hypothetical protein QTO34_008257 [Eptesicus nilssonii]